MNRVGTRHSTWTRVAGILATSGLLLGLAACASSENSGDDAQKTTLTIATDQVATNIDPSLSSGSGAYAFQNPTYQGLLHVKGLSDVVPSLAKSFKWIGDGNTQFQIKLRPGLKFSDGTKLDSAAVKTSIEHFKAGKSVFAYAAAPIESMDTPDSLTVVFHLSTATPQFAMNLAEGTGMGMIISPAAIKSGKNLATSTAGAGPYQLTDKGTIIGSVYTLIPNPYYYDQSAIYYKKIVVKVIANAETALSALRSGQVDVTYGQPSKYKSVSASKNLNAVAFPVGIEGIWLHDQFGTLVPALGDLKVRQAIQYAVDRKAIAKAVTHGTGGSIEQSVTPDTLGYDKSLNGTYPYDPAKAKKLLSEAGYGDGFSMKLNVPPQPDLGILAQAFAEQMSKVGIDVKLVTATTFPEWVQNDQSGDFPIATVGLQLAGMPVAMDQLWSANALMNPRKLDFPEITSAAAVAATKSGEEADKAWTAVNKLTVDKAYQVPITTTSLVQYWNDKVTGVGDSAALNPVFYRPVK